jgi:hypothetical protein
VAEADHLILTRLGRPAEHDFVQPLFDGVFVWEPLSDRDLRRARELAVRFHDHDLGLTRTTAPATASRRRSSRSASGGSVRAAAPRARARRRSCPGVGGDAVAHLHEAVADAVEPAPLAAARRLRGDVVGDDLRLEVGAGRADGALRQALILFDASVPAFLRARIRRHPGQVRSWCWGPDRARP